MISPKNIKFIDETGSTNADLAAALRSERSPKEGDWLVARRQTAGRGRQGREWFDGNGNFMGSTVVELRAGDPPAASLGFVAALAIWDAVNEATGLGHRLRLKWPNDVLLDGGKLSGILLELVGRSVVAGMGVNLVQAPELSDRKTSSLPDFSEPLDAFANRLAERFSYWLNEWRVQGLVPLLNRFIDRSIHAHGSAIAVHDADGSRVSGTFAGLVDSDGALRLRLADGSERVIRAGDVA